MKESEVIHYILKNPTIIDEIVSNHASTELINNWVDKLNARYNFDRLTLPSPITPNNNNTNFDFDFSEKLKIIGYDFNFLKNQKTHKTDYYERNTKNESNLIVRRCQLGCPKIQKNPKNGFSRGI